MTTLLIQANLQESPAHIDALDRPDLDGMNDLLRQEIAVADAYRRAMEIMPQDRSVAEWLRIRSEHQRAVTMLAVRIRLNGGEPVDPSRAWRVSALTMFSIRLRTALASLLRDLIRAEEHLARCYEDILDAQELSHETHEIAQNDLLPRCREHIGLLGRLHSKCEA